MEGQKETVGLGETKDKIIRVLEKEIIQKEGSKREKAACEAVFKRWIYGMRGIHRMPGMHKM